MSTAVTSTGIISTEGDWRRVVRSSDGRYRYRLEHAWGPSFDAREGYLCWVMVNPSIASEARDDHTMRTVRRFTRREGYAHLVVVNLYALVATDPSELAGHPDPEGLPENLAQVQRAVAGADRLVCAWGASLDAVQRRRGTPAALATLRGRPAWCLGRTAGGYPRHPSRLEVGTPLERFEP